MTILKMSPCCYVIYVILSLQHFSRGEDVENLLQTIPTSVYVDDKESYNTSLNLFERLIGKTILDAQYQFWCNYRHRQIQQPSTEERVNDKRIAEEQTERVAMYLVSTCNSSESMKTIGRTLLPFSIEMETNACLDTVLSDNECRNATLPIDYNRLQEKFASMVWNNEDMNTTHFSFVTLISPEEFSAKPTVTLPEAVTDLRIAVSDPSLSSTGGVEWQFSTTNLVYETGKQCTKSCPKDLEPNDRVIYFNGTSLDITSPRIFGSYWNCVVKVKFYLRNQEIALVLNILKDQHVWTHRFYTTNTWTEYVIPIGQIDGIFNVQIQMYRIKQTSWRVGKLQEVVFENCNLSSEHAEKPEPGLHVSMDTFVCKTGVSITPNEMCDFHNNCLHGDDESEEICGNGFSLGLCDFERNVNCLLIFGDYKESTSIIKGANTTAALTDGRSSLKGHVLAFEDRTFSQNTGFITVNLTQPESYLASNKSCVFQVDIFSTVSVGLFSLVVDVIDDETKEEILKLATDLKTKQWQKYRLLIPDFSERNVSTFYMFIYTALSTGDFLGFDNIYISPQCIATDPTKTVLEEIHEESNFVMIVTVSCVSMAVLWTTILLLIYMRYTKMPKIGNSRKRLTFFGVRTRSLKCVPDSAPLLRRLNENLWQDHPNYLMYKEILTQDLSDDIKNLSRYKLKLTKVLGSGAFGEVLQGQLTRGVFIKHVAVKRLSGGCSEKERTDFLVEALTMSKFKHDNIVCCLGIYVKNGALLLVEELMAGGDLKQFLVESRPNIDETPVLSTDELLSLANDICQACSYLEEHKFIHRDIASRNCLLTARTPDRVAKMADFGLARDIIQNDSYKKCGRSMLPVRWLPPESYLEGIFSTKSDVWAYGILLWEIFSFGYDPYPSMKCEEMMAKVNNGQRMAAPSRCPTAIYDVMMLCWQHDPKSRPSFERLCEYLQKIRKNVCINIVCNINLSGDDKEDDRDSSDDENTLHVWHYNGNYAVEEDTV